MILLQQIGSFARICLNLAWISGSKLSPTAPTSYVYDRECLELRKIDFLFLKSCWYSFDYFTLVENNILNVLPHTFITERYFTTKTQPYAYDN